MIFPLHLGKIYVKTTAQGGVYFTYVICQKSVEFDCKVLAFPCPLIMAPQSVFQK